jgi:GxxExxY protein
MKYQELTSEIINAAFEVHNTLGFGFLEIVYERALLLELQNRGLKAESQLPVRVFYKEQEVGTYKVDILVENEIVLELKAITTLRVEDELQLVNYLQATKKEIGLLINFGSQKVEFKRKYRIYKEKKR